MSGLRVSSFHWPAPVSLPWLRCGELRKVSATAVENIREICQNIAQYPSKFPKFQSNLRTALADSSVGLARGEIHEVDVGAVGPDEAALRGGVFQPDPAEQRKR